MANGMEENEYDEIVAALVEAGQSDANAWPPFASADETDFADAWQLMGELQHDWISEYDETNDLLGPD